MYQHQTIDPAILFWVAVVIVMGIVFMMVACICYGLYQSEKSNRKQRKRKRMEIRRREKKKSLPLKRHESQPAEELDNDGIRFRSQQQLFEDYEEFERMIGLRTKKEPERIKVEVVQLPCGDDLAKGERTQRTKRIHFETRPYRDPFCRKPRYYDSATGKYCHYEPELGRFVDCHV